MIINTTTTKTRNARRISSCTRLCSYYVIFYDVPVQISVPHRNNEIAAGPKYPNLQRGILGNRCM